jgi:hypothetical protein
MKNVHLNHFQGMISAIRKRPNPKHIQNEFSIEVRLKLFAVKLKSQTGNKTQPCMAAVECVMGVINRYGADTRYLQTINNLESGK